MQGYSLLYQKLHVTIDCAFRAYSFPVYSLRTGDEISRVDGREIGSEMSCTLPDSLAGF